MLNLDDGAARPTAARGHAALVLGPRRRDDDRGANNHRRRRAVRDALRKEAGGDRAPYPAWVSTAWHVLRWDEPSARVSWELVSLALHQSASVDAPRPCAALAAFVGTRAALAASRAPAVVEDEARIQTRAAAEDEAPHAKRGRRAAAAVRAAAPVAGAVTETLFEDVSEDDVVISKRSGVVVVDDVQCSILVERCRDCRVYVPNHAACASWPASTAWSTSARRASRR